MTPRVRSRCSRVGCEERVRDDPDALVEQYQDLMTDANRIDLEFIVRYASVTP